MSKVLRENRASQASAMPAQSAGPERVQLSRAKGWRMPANTVKVDRSTVWGNPFRRGVGGVKTNKEAVKYFRYILAGYYPFCCGPEISDCARYRVFAEDHIHELRGKNLACWCRPQDACHADVLLEIANRPLADSALGARRRERGERNGLTQNLPATDQ